MFGFRQAIHLPLRWRIMQWRLGKLAVPKPFERQSSDSSDAAAKESALRCWGQSPGPRMTGLTASAVAHPAFSAVKWIQTPHLEVLSLRLVP